MRFTAFWRRFYAYIYIVKNSKFIMCGDMAANSEPDSAVYWQHNLVIDADAASCVFFR